MKRISIDAKPLEYAVREEMNTLRTNIQFAGADKKVFLFTSSISGEGKSQTTFNLAKVMAELGKRVILVDTDMRKSAMVRNVEKGKVAYGLSHYLSGQCNLAEAVYGTNIPGLHMLFAGTVPPNPTELLSSSLFENTITSFRDIYDYVIVDSAPLGLVVDAAIIAKHCDASILVIQSNSIKYRFAQETKEKLVATDCPFLGVVLNKIEREKNGKYYGKYYKKYYGEKYEGYGKKPEQKKR